MLYPVTSDQPAIYVIHENQEWCTPLFSALQALNAPYHDWDMSDASLDIMAQAPNGIFYNRMSASSHSRGHRFAPEITTGLLAWLEGQDRIVLNGRFALHLEVSKLVQYAALQKAGLAVPETHAVTNGEALLRAYEALDLPALITKHNRAGKGLGVKLLTSLDAAKAHITSDDFKSSVDGITLLQRYIKPADQTITRLEFIDGAFLYAVKVDTSNGFELCPADVCEIGSAFCPTDQSPRHAFDIDKGFAASTLGQEVIPKCQAVMAKEGLDVAAFEFVVGEDGVPYFYDINTNTNYNSEAEARAGLFAMPHLAKTLANKLTALTSDGIALAS